MYDSGAAVRNTEAVPHSRANTQKHNHMHTAQYINIGIIATRIDTLSMR